MGYSTESDICENVVELGDVDFLSDYNDKVNDSDNVFDIGHDWKVIKQAVLCGKKSSLYADKITKDKFVIYLLNSSEYEMVGEHWWVIFSDDNTSVKKFLKDFNEELGSRKFKIKDLDAVQQTL